MSLNTESYSDPQEALADIKSMMSRSGRFLSLSGLSGVWAGLCATVCAAFVYFKVGKLPFSGEAFHMAYYSKYGTFDGIGTFLISVGLPTIIVSVIGAFLFTQRRSKHTGSSLWNSSSKAMLESMLIPLAVGGFLVLAHWYHQSFGFTAAITLICYGLALLAGGKYTLDEIKYLGYFELLLGITVAFFPQFGLESWLLGFGVLHIVYGSIMYNKYESKHRA